VGNYLGAEDRQDTGDVSTVTVAVNNNMEGLSAHVAQVNAGINAVGIPSLGQSASHRCLPLIFITDFPIP